MRNSETSDFIFQGDQEMTKYEYIEQQRNNMRIAMERTTGEMRAVWESKYRYFEEKLNNLTVEEAGEIVE